MPGLLAGLGLGSRVNGVEGGSCKAGLCRIDGGSDSGRNRFHRLSRFDTRGAIQGVEIQSDGIRNLVLGVTAAEGSFIDKSVSLTAPAHLFLLSRPIALVHISTTRRRKSRRSVALVHTSPYSDNHTQHAVR